MDLKKLLKIISFFFLFIFFPSYLLPYPKTNSELAFITNQESNKVDVIDLKKRKKIYEFNVGSKPAGIHVDSEKKKYLLQTQKAITFQL